MELATLHGACKPGKAGHTKPCEITILQTICNVVKNLATSWFAHLARLANLAMFLARLASLAPCRPKPTPLGGSYFTLCKKG